MYVEKENIKNKKKFKSNRKNRTCYNKSFYFTQLLVSQGIGRQQISNRNYKTNK